MRRVLALVLGIVVAIAGVAAAEPAPASSVRTDAAESRTDAGTAMPTLAASAGAPAGLAVAATSPAPAFLDAPSRRAPLPAALAVLRLVGAIVIVGVLLGAAVVAHRRWSVGGLRGSKRAGWLARWAPPPGRESDRIQILSRSYLGARESLGVVRVGDERFLIGVTNASITLVSRLGTAPSAVRSRSDRLEQPERPSRSDHQDRLGQARRSDRPDGLDQAEHVDAARHDERSRRAAPPSDREFAHELAEAEAAPSEEAIRSALSRTRARLEHLELAAWDRDA